MTTLSIKGLIAELEMVSGNTRTADLAMAAAGKLKEAEELRVAVEERAAAAIADAVASRKVTEAVNKLRANTVSVRD